MLRIVLGFPPPLFGIQTGKGAHNLENHVFMVATVGHFSRAVWGQHCHSCQGCSRRPMRGQEKCSLFPHIGAIGPIATTIIMHLSTPHLHFGNFIFAQVQTVCQDWERNSADFAILKWNKTTECTNDKVHVLQYDSQYQQITWQWRLCRSEMHQQCLTSKRNAMCDGPTTHCRTLEFLKLLTTAGGEYPLRNFSPTSLNLQRNKMQHETKKIGSGYPDRKKQFSRRNSVNLNSDEQQENGLPQNRTCNRWLHLMQQPLHYRKTLKVIHHD